jgi:hypothetical protein
MEKENGELKFGRIKSYIQMLELPGYKKGSKPEQC